MKWSPRRNNRVLLPSIQGDKMWLLLPSSPSPQFTQPQGLSPPASQRARNPQGRSGPGTCECIKIYLSKLLIVTLIFLPRDQTKHGHVTCSTPVTCHWEVCWWASRKQKKTHKNSPFSSSTDRCQVSQSSKLWQPHCDHEEEEVNGLSEGGKAERAAKSSRSYSPYLLLLRKKEFLTAQ